MQLPLYIEISENLKNFILDGNIKIGEKIPGDFELMKQYQVSRDTIRKAIKVLVDDGYLIRRPGKGTFLCRRRKVDSIEKIISFSSELIARGYVPSTKLIKFKEINATPEISEMLKCNQNEDIYLIERIRYASKLPIAFETTYLLKKIVGEIKKNELLDSMYEFLSREKNIEFIKMVQEIKPKMLDSKVAKMMKVDIMPVIHLSRIIYTKNNMPFFALSFLLRGDNYSMKNEVILK
ncbi:GntR family transcriptional regulator [Tepiditoga spiralis]|uniref:GntR family transcriptional regulator n=1 Tax=Tepiditoga spiralis TaxID=2108365 RepID=A0A7G1G7A7_9BACT|nr:GntR family transcriptional regulator [Tepiditoga spiralis]BBE31226.1 GntR family transcriptional regulator [Tepiditoga spiralis]